MRKAPPVKAELPPREASGEISSCSTEAPFSLADKAAQVAALPAPTTMMSCSGMSMAECLQLRPPGTSQNARDWRRAFFETPAARAPQDEGLSLCHYQSTSS